MFPNDRKRTRTDGPEDTASVSPSTVPGGLRLRVVNTTPTSNSGDGASGSRKHTLIKKNVSSASRGAETSDAQTNSSTASTRSSTSQSHAVDGGARRGPRRPLGLGQQRVVASSSSSSSAVLNAGMSRVKNVTRQQQTGNTNAKPSGLSSLKRGNENHTSATAKATQSSPSSVDAKLHATWKAKCEGLEEEVSFLEAQSAQLTEETAIVEDAIEGMLTEFEEGKRNIEVHRANTVAHYHGLMRTLRAREDVCLAAKQRALTRIEASIDTVRQLEAQQEKTQEAIVLAADQRETLESQLAALQSTEAQRRAFLQQLEGEEERMKDASYGLSGEVRELVLEMERLKTEKRKTEVAAMEMEITRRELYSLCEELKGSIRVYCRVKGSVNVDLPPSPPSTAATVEVATTGDVAGSEQRASVDGVVGRPSPTNAGRSGSVESSLSIGTRSTADNGTATATSSRSAASAVNAAFINSNNANSNGAALCSGRSTTRSSVTTPGIAADEAGAVNGLDEGGDGSGERCLFSFPDRTIVTELNLMGEEEEALIATPTGITTSLSTTEADNAPPLSSPPSSAMLERAEAANVGAEAGLPYTGGRSITIHLTRSNATSTGVSNTEESFTYDRVFTSGAHQGEVYRDVEPLVRNAVDGYRVCIFAYGQTGSGKTFTMEGDLRHTPAAYGVTPRALQTILQRQNELAKEGWSYELSCTFIEIYNDVIRDLFQSGSARYEAAMQQSGNAATYHTIKHSGDCTQITNVSEKRICNMEDFFALYKQAVEQRSTAKTDLNDKSSRSHCIFTLYITGTNATIHQRSTGVLCLVDLAGSERVNESGAQGKQFKEAVNINRSLLDLGKCIRALRSGAVVPWRNCKLTYLLQNYLGAKGGKMLMIVTVSNRQQHAQESVNSLRFAARVQEVFVGTSVKRVVNMM